MDGILIVDKPEGLTSHDVVDLVRQRFHLQKVGHAGTLDPQATGVLVVLIGKFTKKSATYSGCDKEYAARLTLGMATDTQDSQGRVVKREYVEAMELEKVERVFQQFLGKVEQIPPMFSALKYKGQRLYALARKGIEVQRPARSVYIYKINLTGLEPPHINFTVSCSKGTYIRTLCMDIAERLGCVGYMSKLRRIRCGTFTLNQAISLGRLQGLSWEELSTILTQDEAD